MKSALLANVLWVSVALAASSTACTITPATCSGSEPDWCNGYCTNFANDPRNCGGCNYVCGGGTVCGNGQCFAGGACTPDGYSCLHNADCCSGLCDYTCGTPSPPPPPPPPPGCAADGAACAYDADCCSALCAPDGYCGVPACAPEGDACGTDNDCCSPLYCDNGGCSPCVSSGNPCNVDADCCSAVCTYGGCD